MAGSLRSVCWRRGLFPVLFRGTIRGIWSKGSQGRALTISARALMSEKVTHTGQQWEETDHRRVRFTDRDKLVNDQFAIDLLAEEPVVVVKGNHVWCDGGKGALGHPKVYINLDKPEINDCGYCGKRFVSEASKDQFKTEKLTYEQ